MLRILALLRKKASNLWIILLWVVQNKACRLNMSQWADLRADTRVNIISSFFKTKLNKKITLIESLDSFTVIPTKWFKLVTVTKNLSS